MSENAKKDLDELTSIIKIRQLFYIGKVTYGLASKNKINPNKLRSGVGER